MTPGFGAQLRDKVVEFRRRRFEQGVTALAALYGGLPGGHWDRDDPVDVAVVAAAVDKAQRAIPESNETALAEVHWALSVADALPRYRTVAGSMLAVESASCPSYEGSSGARCYDFLTHNVLDAPKRPALDTLITAAVEEAASADLLSTLTLELGVALLLQDRHAHEGTSSYTLAWLPSVVHVDRIDHPIRFCELLLHEATHCLLNDLLAAHGENLPEEPKWYSPWRLVDRPATGILHAVITFSTLLPFYAHYWSKYASDDWLKVYMEGRLLAEYTALLAAEAAFRQACEFVQNADLRQFLVSTYDSALDYGRSVDHELGDKVAAARGRAIGEPRGRS